MGLFDLLRAAVQPAAAARAGYLQGQDQEQDKQRKTLLETVKNAREQALTNAQIAHLNAQAHSLDEGQWGPAFNAVDEDGKNILVQQHKQSGALRRAMITDGATDASSATSPAMPSIAEPKPANLTLPPDSQDMTGADTGSSPLSPMQQGAQGASAQPGQPTPKKTALSPYVKPATSTRPASMIPGTPEWLAAQEAAAQIHAKYRPAAKDQTQVIQGIDPNTGQPSFAEYDKTTHKLRPIDFAPKPAGAGANAQTTSKVGQAGEMLKKSADLLPTMERLNVALGNSAAQDVATNGIGIGHNHIPGTQGLGAMMVNKTPEYATYQAALTPFVLAAAHALSGARINDEQVKQIRASVEIKPGDTPPVRQQKLKNVIDLMNSINGSLPADAIGAQESQMDDGAFAILQGHGYKPAKTRAGAGAPSVTPSGTPPTGPTNRGGKYGKLPPGPTGPPTPNGIDLNDATSTAPAPKGNPYGAFAGYVPKKPDEELE